MANTSRKQKTFNLNPVSRAVIAACGATATVLTVPAALAQEEAGSARAIEEITVTASRRAERLQAVPIALSAMTGEKLRELGIDSFEDYIALLPGVNA